MLTDVTRTTIRFWNIIFSGNDQIGSEREEKSACSLNCAWTEDVKIRASEASNIPIIGGGQKRQAIAAHAGQ